MIEHLHLVIGLILALLGTMAVVLKFVFKFIDQRWPDQTKVSNGNGETKKVCFMGEGEAERIMDRMDDRHTRLREIIHQNHAATLAILTQMSQALDSRRETEKEIAITLKLIERHLAVGHD